MRAIYLRSEVVRAIIDTLIELAAGLPWSITPVDEDLSHELEKKDPEKYQDQRRRIQWLTDFFKRPNGYQSLEDFHRMLLRDLLIFDAGSYKIVMADYGRYRLPIELGVVAGDTVESNAMKRVFPSAIGSLTTSSALCSLRRMSLPT